MCGGNSTGGSNPPLSDFRPEWAKALLECNKAKFIPCTPEGVVSLLQLEGVVIEGKNVVVVGKGETAGAPMATVFRNHDATVTICHIKTSREDLEFYVRHADIVISCVGKMNVVDAEWFKEGSQFCYGRGFKRIANCTITASFASLGFSGGNGLVPITKAVSACRNGGLHNQDVAANGTVLTLGQARFGAGGGNRDVDLLGVTERG